METKMNSISENSFSYRDGNSHVFSYTFVPFGGKLQTVYFKMAPVNNNVAVISFVSGENHNLTISPPNNFSFRTSDGTDIPSFKNQFFVTWTDDYALIHNQNEIWSLRVQRQQYFMFSSDGITKL